MVQISNISHTSQPHRMCLHKKRKMASSPSQSTLESLQGAYTKQTTYYNDQALRGMTEDELERYMNMRNACVQYIRNTRAVFESNPEAFAMAVGILDVFLWKMKVTERHMSIVSATCLLLACKVKEEYEDVPSPEDMAKLSYHPWTANDLCRMETHMLKKLNWTLSSVTYLDFLPHLADLYGVDRNIVCSDRMLFLAERCMFYRSTVEFKPNVLAISLFQLASQQTQFSGTLQSPLVFDDLNIQDSAITECKQVLSSHALSHSPVPRRSVVSFPNKVFDKPSEIGSTCLPTISEE